MFQIHYDYYKKTYGIWARLLFTDTDSLCYIFCTVNLMMDMLSAPKEIVIFDLKKALTLETLQKMFPDDVAVSTWARLKKIKGQLGALKWEAEMRNILEFVGLASKLYSMFMVGNNAANEKKETGPPKLEKTSMHCRGTPKDALKKQSSHEKNEKCDFRSPAGRCNLQGYPFDSPPP